MLPSLNKVLLLIAGWEVLVQWQCLAEVLYKELTKCPLNFYKIGKKEIIETIVARNRNDQQVTGWTKC